MGVKANRVEDCEDTGRPGDFTLTGVHGRDGIHGMIFICPCGCGDISGVSFDTVPRTATDSQRWAWDGSEDAPTLSPSLNKTRGCGWHGWLQNGEFRK